MYKENYSYNNSVIIEDAAWSLHYHFLINHKDSDPLPSAFAAVLKMARVYDFKEILDDGAELYIIANNVSIREHNERESIHGRLPSLEEVS